MYAFLLCLNFILRKLFVWIGSGKLRVFGLGYATVNARGKFIEVY